MHLASVYLYVRDMKSEVKFWTSFLGVAPTSTTDTWCEYPVGNARLGLLLDEDSVTPVLSSSVLVLEVEDQDIDEYIEKAQAAGGYIVLQGLSSRIIMASPSRHRFELQIGKHPSSAA